MLLPRLKKEILGVSFTQGNLEDICNALMAEIEGGAGCLALYTANADHIVLLNRNNELREAYSKAWCITIDSGIICAYAKIQKLASSTRVTGSDIVEKLVPVLNPSLHTPFFLVANDDIKNKLEQLLINSGYGVNNHSIEIPPFGFEKDVNYSMNICERIRSIGATHLFMGVGCPKSEVWILDYREYLGDLYALCVGAGLGYLVKHERRAPKFMRRIGSEWIWRLLSEPRRLGWRYLGRGSVFLVIIIRDILKGGSR